MLTELIALPNIFLRKLTPPPPSRISYETDDTLFKYHEKLLDLQRFQNINIT